MNRSILTLFAGLAAGLLSYTVFFSAFKPCEDKSLECQLSWIKDYLSLTPEQYELVVAMHRDHQPEVNRLEHRVEQLEGRIAALEEERIENDRIDFLTFYHYLQEKVDLDKTRDSSTESFLSKVSDVMSSDQKARFNKLIGDFRKSTGKES
jgi:hypothetical protein